MLTVADLESLLASGYELRGFELKGPGNRSDSHFLAKIVKAAISMGNLRDGGNVVVGVADANPAAMLPGLNPDDLASWLAYDDVARKFAEYASPPLQFNIAQRELKSGAAVVVIEVSEFADIPHLCARDYQGVLRKGALYVRSRRVPETAEVPTIVEMREVLQVAPEKALRAFVETAERGGVAISPAQPSDTDAFAEERRDAWQ